jgi:hypothetical protein
MRYISTLSLLQLFIWQSAVAQIKLEHSYPKGFLWRTRLDVSGETYALRQTGSCDVTLFDATHQPKDNIITQVPFRECSHYFFSEHLFDQDKGIETLYYWLDEGPGITVGFNYQDDNEPSRTLSYRAYQISNLPGLQPKIIAGNLIRSIPELAVEHHYNTFEYLQRLSLPVDGERYVAYKGNSFDGFHFFDAQHQFIKSVNLPFDGFRALDNITQQYFNTDPLLEFMGARWSKLNDINGNRKVFEVVNETGKPLFSMPCEYYSLHTLENQPDLLFIYAYESPQKWQTTILDPFTFKPLHIFKGTISRKKMPDGSIVFLENIVGDKILVYNDQYMLIKTIPVPNTYNLVLTKGQFSKENKFELLYSVRSNNNEKWVRCSNEDGQILYAFPGATNFLLDQQPGMKDKLLMQYQTSAIDSTQVYAFTKSTYVKETPEPGLSVSPNPFSQQIDLQLDVLGNYQIRLYNAVGQLLLEHHLNQQNQKTIPAADLPAGAYWLLIQNGQWQKSIRMIKSP